MKLIDVLDGGMLTTVQDLGRFGYQRYGVPVSGVLDPLALRAANRLVGNTDDEAGLEITLIGPRLRFLAPATIALTGADLGATIDRQALPLWRTVQVASGSVLAFAGVRAGMRAYLAVAGGIYVPRVLGSRSTYVRSRLGGFEGRALKAGDVLEIPGEIPILHATVRDARSGGSDVGRGFSLAGVSVEGGQDASGGAPAGVRALTVRVIPGPQADRFTDEGMRTFLSSEYRVTPQSDRMGYRLEGPRISHLSGPDIVSDGTPPGAVQVAGDGMPIVLLADRGTAGGYTKIATVIGVDLRLFAQAAPGDVVRFEATTIEAAHQALRKEEAWLERLRAGGGTTHDRRKKAAAAAAAVAVAMAATPTSQG